MYYIIILGDSMINKLYIYESSDLDPYRNIATEKYLLEKVEPGSCILYLWQNKNTVVIGRNQNPWAECRTGLLEQEGGKLARRLSGGGAVYHDLGNLNFTFLVCQEDYDVDKQLSVIQAACLQVGIPAEKSGRNDMLADGRKFSGNAFYHTNGKSYHHGTLLVNADMEMLSRYLTPPKAKLQAKGVQSVRSRVVNLVELCPGLTCDNLKTHLRNAFTRVYNLPVQELQLDSAATAYIQSQANMLGSWDWLYGTRLPFSLNCEERFSWGYIQLQLQVESGVITQASVYSDAMDWALPQLIKQALSGCQFVKEKVVSVLEGAITDKPTLADIIQLLEQQEML